MSIISKRLIIVGADFSSIKINAPIYQITSNITNGTISGASSIAADETVILSLTPNSNYTKPDTISVTGATYTYVKATGLITLTNPTNNVTITATCPVARIPSGYTEVTAVGANNNRAYLSFTDVPYDATKKLEVETHMNYLTSSALGSGAFGMGWNYGGLMSCTFLNTSANEVRDGSQTIGMLVTDLGMSATNYDLIYKSVINAGSSGTTVSTITNANDLTKTRTVSRAHTSLAAHATNAYPIGIYTDSDASELNPHVPVYYEIYYVTIKVDDVVVANLVPCVRDSDNVAGFWDNVANTFRVSAFSGEAFSVMVQ